MELTMNSYQKAVEALKQCVKDAVDNDVTPNLQSEIWRHYQGMKAIAEQLPEETGYSFSINGDSITIGSGVYDPDYNVQAAQPVNSFEFSSHPGGYDIITFS
jgi:hypothetical protein